MVADAFPAVVCEGDFDALAKVLDLDVVARSGTAVATSCAHFAGLASPPLCSTPGVGRPPRYASSSTPTVSPSLSSPLGRKPRPA